VSGEDIKEMQDELHRKQKVAFASTPLERFDFEKKWYETGRSALLQEAGRSAPAYKKYVCEETGFVLMVREDAEEMAKKWYDKKAVFHGKNGNFELEKQGNFYGRIEGNTIFVEQFEPIAGKVEFVKEGGSAEQYAQGSIEQLEERVEQRPHYKEHEGELLTKSHSHPYGPIDMSGKCDFLPLHGPSFVEDTYEVETARSKEGKPAFGFSYCTMNNKGMFFVLSEDGKKMHEYKFKEVVPTDIVKLVRKRKDEPLVKLIRKKDEPIVKLIRKRN
jgi:hypothetical protein